MITTDTIDATPLVGPLVTERADFQSLLKHFEFDLLRTVGDVGSNHLGEIRRHLQFAGKRRFVALVATDHREAVIGLRVVDDRPFRPLTQEPPQRRQETRPAIFPLFAKRLHTLRETA